jgi:hypothetical protein
MNLNGRLVLIHKVPTMNRIFSISDPLKGVDGLMQKAEELKKQIPNVHVLDQFTNPANADAHFRWTGTLGNPEISFFTLLSFFQIICADRNSMCSAICF